MQMYDSLLAPKCAACASDATRGDASENSLDRLQRQLLARAHLFSTVLELSHACVARSLLLLRIDNRTRIRLLFGRVGQSLSEIVVD